MKSHLAIPLALSLLVGCKPRAEMKDPEMVSQHIIVNDTLIDSGEPYDVIDPVWWTANIYGSHQEYVESLKPFSRAQRLLHAISWYEVEVNNGGHDQFYFNSTGIVWEDALEGLREIGALDRAKILEESAVRMGGRPSFDRDGRYRQLETHAAKFDDLDDRFYDLDDGLEELMSDYIKGHREDFYFDGIVSKPESR